MVKGRVVFPGKVAFVNETRNHVTVQMLKLSTRTANIGRNDRGDCTRVFLVRRSSVHGIDETLRVCVSFVTGMRWTSMSDSHRSG
jgi:hypothetical protein